MTLEAATGKLRWYYQAVPNDFKGLRHEGISDLGEGSVIEVVASLGDRRAVLNTWVSA